MKLLVWKEVVLQATDSRRKSLFGFLKSSYQCRKVYSTKICYGFDMSQGAAMLCS